MEQVGRYLDIISLSASLDPFQHSTCVALQERLIWFGAWLVRRLIVFPLTDHACSNRHCIRDIRADPQIDSSGFQHASFDRPALNLPTWYKHWHRPTWWREA